MININDYVVKLLNDKSFLFDEYYKYIENDYARENVHGYVDDKLLYKIIKKAKTNRKIAMLLTDILMYIDSSSISDVNFKLLLKFPFKRRRITYLSNIGHTSLSFYQMQILSRAPLGFEAFSWMFDNICKYDIFTSNDMAYLLAQNTNIRPAAVKLCMEQALQRYGDTEKTEIAKQWLLKYELDH